MKAKLLLIGLIGLSGLSAIAQPPTIGGYNVYFGDLHNHSAVSDGSGTPADAYNYAKNTAHLDFFGLTDHSDNSGSMTESEWADIRNQANASNEDGVFTSFYGFEWSANPGYGHVTVLNTDDYCTTTTPTDTFEALVIWLASRLNGVAFFNHPAREINSFEFSYFTTTPSDQFIGIELWNRGDGFNTYYYNDGFYTGDNQKSYYDEANSRGWKIGALGSGDNHFGTWGTAYPYRMAILANNLTRTDLLDAMRARRFYSTLDRNLSLSFKINGMEMGSTIVGNNYTLQVQASDGNGEIFNQVVLYNQNHSVVGTWSMNTSLVDISMNISTTDGEYYYVKVRQADGNEAISSPIWISGVTSNWYPLCSVSSPAGGTLFNTPADITINASAIDPDGSVSKVEFYQGTAKIGEDLTSPYSFTWNGVTIGSYSLTVKATDNLGAVSTSSAVSVSVGGIPIIVTADSKTKVYGGSDPALTYRITSGSLAGGDTFTGSLTRDTGENAGNYTIRQGSLALDSKYTLTFVTSNLVITERPITIRADAKSKIYGNSDPPLTYAITSGTLAGADTFSGSLARDAGENVGTYGIRLGTLRLGSNYNITFNGADLIIATRAISVTANNSSKIYGDADMLTYQITSGSLAGTDTFTGSLTREAGEDIGTYAITRGSLSPGSNYNMTFSGAVLEITIRAISVSANDITKVYGDAEQLTYRITSGSLAGTDSFTGALTRTAGEAIGTYRINQGTLAAGPNYALTFTGANLVITARAITVSSDNISKVYGDADHLTYRITAGSLAGSDTFTGSVTRDAGENVGTYNIGQGTLSLNSNYIITFRGSVLTITPRSIMVTADNKSKVYGETDPDLTLRITSGTLVNADVLSGTLTRNPGENVGSYTISKGNLALNSNYLLTFTGAAFTITKRPITVAAENKTKMFGEADPELTYLITSGHLAGNGDAFSGALIRETGEDVGSYSIMQGTLSLSSNYALTFTGAELTIGKTEIIIAAEAKTKIYGETDPALTYQVASGSLKGGDKITGELSRESGENVGTYAISQGTLELSGNYTLVFIMADLQIIKRSVTVTADHRTKVLGEPDPELTYSLTSGTLAGEDSFSGILARKEGEEVGTYPIRIGTLALSDDYIIEFVESDFTITADYEIKVYPNPFTDLISFEVELNYDSDVTLEIFNQSGIKLATVFSGKVNPALHHFEYVPENARQGLLIYQFTINGHVMRGKIIHI